MIPRKPEWEDGSSPDMHERLQFAERELAHSQAVAARAVKALREVYALLDGGDERTPEWLAKEVLEEIDASGWTE